MTINNNKIVSATDTGNSKYQVQFEFNDLRFTAYDNPTGTDDLYAVTVEATAFYDASDGQAIRCLVQNAKA